MHSPPRILAVDDSPENLEVVRVRLESTGYEVIEASSGREGLAKARVARPDLLLLDIMMPEMDGIAVLRELKQDPTLGFMPVILLTAKADTHDVVQGLNAGGDDYLAKPFDHATLLARVRSMLRIKALHDQVQEQTERLARQADELAVWNRTLEERVASQVAELDRAARLRRFLAPQIVDVIASADQSTLLASHRREITVVFCDLRGFTAFSETAEPEEVLDVLRAYHRTLGDLIQAYQGTLERFAGDGILIFFNDPVPFPDHTLRAVRMAAEMRRNMQELTEKWRRRGFELGFGVGIAVGYATLGQIGSDWRFEYAAVGSVINLASRLCSEAAAGQILITQRVFAEIEAVADAARLDDKVLHGFHRPVPVYEVTALRNADS